MVSVTTSFPKLFFGSAFRRMNFTDRQAVSHLENVGVEAKGYLNEQLKIIDNHVSNHLATCGDMAEFLRRKAEIDLDYSKKLEKLTDQYMTKVNAASVGGGGGKSSNPGVARSMNGYQQCFYSMLNISKQTCLDISNESVLTTEYIMAHVLRVTSVLKHVYEQCRIPLQKTHDEFIILSGQLTAFLKTYQQAHANFRQENVKFEAAISEQDKLKSASAQDAKAKNASKLKTAEKKRMKCQIKRDEAFSLLNKKRNEYLLALQAMNYFLYDIFSNCAPQSIDAMFVGHYEWSQCVFKSIYLLQEECLKKRSEKVREFRNSVNNLNGEKECAAVIDNNSQHFTPKESLKFNFTPHSIKNFSDDISVLFLDPPLKSTYDMVKQNYLDNYMQVKQVDTEISGLKEQILETVGKLYLDNSTILDSFSPTSRNKSLTFFTTAFFDNLEKLRDLQTAFVTQITERGGVSNSGIRLKGRKDLIESMFGENIEIAVGSYNTVSRNRRRIRGAISIQPAQLKPKYKVSVALFGGRIDSFCSAAQVDIPPVVTSCINRIVNTAGGLTHSGIFRLNGSQSEINNLKALFDKGEDPLDDDANQSWNWNTIAGLLKLYFRELEEPLFPKNRFDELIGTLEKRQNCEGDFLSALTAFASSMNVNVLITMRYLFDFLKLLSQFSEQNMMDDYNLAVCWGPTLLPIPEDRDQVLHHNDTIDIIQTFITQSHQIFPRNYGLLLDDMILDSTLVGSISEEGDLDETDEGELDEPDDGETLSTFSLQSTNAPDLVMDLPSSTNADSSESAENLSASPVPPLTSSTSAPGVVNADGTVQARPRAISLNIDVDPQSIVKSSPIASKKLELERLGGIPLNFGTDPRAASRNISPRTESNKAQSPTGCSQVSISTTESSESLNQPSSAISHGQSVSALVRNTNSSSTASSATASPSLAPKAPLNISSPAGLSNPPQSGSLTPLGDSQKVLPPPKLPKPTFKK